jgi:hypothetical protein
LAELGAKKLTRAIAERHPDLRPMLVVFSECHEMSTRLTKTARDTLSVPHVGMPAKR